MNPILDNFINKRFPGEKYKIYLGQKGDYLFVPSLSDDKPVQVWPDGGIAFFKEGNVETLLFLIEQALENIEVLFENLEEIDESKLNFTVVDSEVYCNDIQLGLRQLNDDKWEIFPTTIDRLKLIDIYFRTYVYKPPVYNYKNSENLEEF